MGLKSLFSTKKVQKSNNPFTNTNLSEADKKNRVAIQFFNRVVKKDTRIKFKFESLNQEKTKLLYKGEYRGGEVGIEVGLTMNEKDVVYLIDDLIKEIDYVVDRLSNFYDEEVAFSRYYIDFIQEGPNVKQFKNIVVLLNDEEKELRYENDLVDMVKAVKNYLSQELTVIEGELGGRKTDYEIDGFNLIAFLAKHKGKRIRVEILEKEEPVQTPVLVNEEDGEDLENTSDAKETNVADADEVGTEDSVGHDYSSIEGKEFDDFEEALEALSTKEDIEDSDTKDIATEEVLEDEQEQVTEENPSQEESLELQDESIEEPLSTEDDSNTEEEDETTEVEVLESQESIVEVVQGEADIAETQDPENEKSEEETTKNES